MPRGSKPGERRGGRKKGTPNKRTVLHATVKAALEAEGCDPAVVMARIALAKVQGKNVDVRLRAAAELLQYIAPKYTRVELGSIGGGPVQMEIFESPADRISGILDRIASRGEGAGAEATAGTGTAGA